MILEVNMSESSWKLANSWWLLLPFGFPIYLNWIAFIYIGVTARHFKWVLYGIIYLIPALFMNIFMTPTSSGETVVTMNSVQGIIILAYYIMGVFSIFHAFYLRKEYLIRSETLNKVKSSESFRQKIVKEYELEYGISESPEVSPNITKNQEKPVSNEFVNNFPSNTTSSVDINKDPEDSLAELPGLNLILAKRAVQLRESGVYFDSAEDFGLALGLKPHIVKKIEPYVVIKPLNDVPTQTTSKTKGRRIDI
jgi:DNA uptake protein ComE-like DNA-binding protein